jgi:two-component system phosphate regulon sensor histidine kinase PhoR
VIITAVAASALLLGGLAAWSDSSDESVVDSGGPVKTRLLISIWHFVGIVGVIWLGRYAIGLAGAVASTAERLRQESADKVATETDGTRPRNSRSFSDPQSLTDELNEVINSKFGQGANKVAAEEQIRDLEIQNQLLERQKRNTEAIIYGIRDAVIVVDEFDRLMMANEAAGRLFDFDFKNSRHRPISELIDKDENGFADFLRNAGAGKGRATRHQIELSRQDSPRTFDCIVSCAYDEEQQVCGVVAVLHDITREKEISQMKNDFVSHVSHELKTPLASITAYSEMLVDGEACDEQTRKEFYSVIQDQARRLNRLIEDILNTSRIESGLIKVDKKPVSLAILIEEQLQMIRSYAEESNIEVVGQKPIVFDQVYVDRDMISQVIVNLLSNAVKYTPSGGSVKIETEVDDTEKTVRVSVTDTGVGISEDEIEHVFEKFYRVGANKGQAKGTGLGLNLVKQIVEKVHGGRVFVRSKVGLGSTFGFELPSAAAQTVEAV